MKKINNTFLTSVIIIIILIVAFVILNDKPNITDEEIVKCIGRNSELYVQLGCRACDAQEELFGDNYQYLTIIDCVFSPNECGDIEFTPTWKIKGESYEKVQSIEKLKELTGC